MAIVQVVHDPKEQKESILDKVLKGVSLANNILEVREKAVTYGDRKKLASLSVANAEAENKSKYSPEALARAATRQGLEDEKLKAETTAANSKAIVNPLDGQKTQAEIDKLKADTKKSLAEAGKVRSDGAPGEAVQGFSVAGGARPTKDDAKILKQAAQYQAVIDTSLGKLEELVKTHGTESFGERSDEMSKLARDAQLNAKELYNLGVLSGPDLELMETIIQDPGSSSTIFKWNSGDRALKSITQAKGIIKGRVDGIAQTRGFSRSDDQGGKDGDGLKLASDTKPRSASSIDPRVMTMYNGKKMSIQEAAKQELVKQQGMKAILPAR